MGRRKQPAVKSPIVESPPQPPAIRCYKPTTDDWAGSYRLEAPGPYTYPMLVVVSLLTLRGGGMRVCVWGNDDTGMERDFDGEFEARAMWNTVLAYECVTMKELARLGFVRA